MLRASLVLTAIAVISLAPVDASACGGCLTPAPTEADAGSTSQSGSVVTDHRMVLSLTGGSTTLWDQIEYAGDPAEFAWVLPIRGKVNVGLGSDQFIEALDKKTAPSIIGPRVLCNPPPQQPFSGGGGSGSGGCACIAMSSSDESVPASAFSPSSDGGVLDDASEGVTIHSREAVGPYDTVQIGGTDTESIVGWLRRNNYEIPANVEPILTRYVTEGFDFLAVRLRPGLGVHAMQPIRVTWDGSMPMLPLRMVAAGVAARVGLKLFVLGDGRWTTKNFPAFTLRDDELFWDFTAGRSNYTALRAAKAADSGDRGWAVETSITLSRSELPPGEPEESPLPSEAGVVDTGPPVSEIDVAFGEKFSLRVTRLRADLPVAALASDLELEADVDQSIIPAEHRLTRQQNADKLCQYGVQSVTARSSSALSTDDAPPTETAECNVTSTPTRLTLPIAFFGALGAWTMLRLQRRRRR